MRIANMQRVILARDDQGNPVFITREWLKALLGDFGDVSASVQEVATTVNEITNVTNTTSTTNVTQVIQSADDESPSFTEADCIAQAQALIQELKLLPPTAPVIFPDDLSPPIIPAPEVLDLGTNGLVSYLLAEVAELRKEIEGLKQGITL
jgi:hypothetical protein